MFKIFFEKVQIKNSKHPFCCKLKTISKNTKLDPLPTFQKSYRGFIAPLYIVFGFPKNQFFPSSALALSPRLPKVICFSAVW